MKDMRIIKGPRLDLVPFSEDLISERYIAWLNDKDVMRYSRQRFWQHDRNSCLKFLRSFENSDQYFWAIMTHDHGHVGNITAKTNAAYATAELTIMIGDGTLHGQGYGLAAWSQAMDFLLSTAGFRKVSAGTMEVNQPMLRVFQKSGMAEEFRMIRQEIYLDNEVDCVVYSKFQSEHS